jgi:outer membrane protein insertion porin family
VLKDLLSEHGHQFSTITPVIKTIPPQSVGLTFKIKEGPTVKVGKIAFDGNYNLSDADAAERDGELAAHRDTHTRSFWKTCLRGPLTRASWTRIRSGCDRRTATAATIKAQTGDAQTHVRDAGGLNWFTLRPSTGKRIDIMMPVDEGERYKLGSITFTGVMSEWNLKALRSLFPRRTASGSTRTLFQQGPEGVREGLWQPGLHQHGGRSAAQARRRGEEAGLLEHRRRMRTSSSSSRGSSSTGNTRTRDKVIRRELLLEEGQVYSKQLWDLSVLRLNQLGYFDTLKVERRHRDRTRTRTTARSSCC